MWAFPALPYKSVATGWPRGKFAWVFAVFMAHQVSFGADDNRKEPFGRQETIAYH